jgi:hypothetical protein
VSLLRFRAPLQVGLEIAILNAVFPLWIVIITFFLGVKN